MCTMYVMMSVVGCLNLQQGWIGKKTEAQGASVEDQGMAVLELTKAWKQIDRDLMEWIFMFQQLQDIRLPSLKLT